MGFAAQRPQNGIHFAILRNDFMLHSPPGSAFGDAQLRQVENNTIAASFGSLSTLASQLHRRNLALAAPEFLPCVPANSTVSGLAAGFKVLPGPRRFFL